MMTEGAWWNLKDAIEAAMVETGYAEACSASGRVDEAVADACTDRTIAPLLAQIDPDNRWLLGELRETGAWDADDLADHSANLQRLVWGIACDWKENGREA